MNNSLNQPSNIQINQSTATIQPQQNSHQVQKQTELGQQVVRQWMKLPVDELVNKLIASFPDSQQTLKLMNQTQIRQIVQQIYSEINVSNIQPQKKPQQAQAENKQIALDNNNAVQTMAEHEKQTQVNSGQIIEINNSIQEKQAQFSQQQRKQGELLSQQAMRAKLIDLLPDIKGEVQSMQYLGVFELYKVVMEQYQKVLTQQNKPQQQEDSIQTKAAFINIDLTQTEQPKESIQLNQINLQQQAKSVEQQLSIIENLQKISREQRKQEQHQQNLTKISQQQIINLDCSNAEQVQVQSNPKRTHQQMRESNPSSSSAYFDPQYLRSKLLIKLPHLYESIKLFKPSELQTIYHQSLLAQKQQSCKKQRTKISFHKSDKAETELFQLKEGRERNKTLVLLHTQYDDQYVDVSEGVKVKQSNGGIIRRTSNDTFIKIFKALSGQ